jgi:hypothetical protein
MIIGVRRCLFYWAYEIGWDNFKNTLWDSMGQFHQVGHDKHLN